MESYKVLRVGPREIAQHRDGLSINTPMVRALTALGLFDRSKAPGPDDAATTSQIKDFNAKIAATPAFFWMVTEGNDRKTQVNAGRAYARAQLAATAHGLSMQPLSQALQEYPEQAQPYAQIHALLQAPPPRYTVQMWSRLGYAPPVGPAPRRGVRRAHASKPEPLRLAALAQAAAAGRRSACATVASRTAARSPSKRLVSLVSRPSTMKPNHTVPTGFSLLPPAGPGDAGHRHADRARRMAHGAERHGARHHFAHGAVRAR